VAVVVFLAVIDPSGHLPADTVCDPAIPVA